MLGIFARSLMSALALSLLLLSSATAADLAQLKAAGVVGERSNGLLGLVKPDAPADVKAFVDNINAQRQAEYQRIAAKNGVTADEVAKLTAQKVINQAAPGQFVDTGAGWQQR
ncbi:YdbL family protein [Methylomonas koyamae]|uniref:YdbL family protein n=1 Tax=Methylomonas koyamae TaxID=702114 RepID=UPI002873BB6E|nr:YdbL family protein [Methylomonas koyamae]WNB75079.1 YdbL family protein [Methylomonas koyamae]